MWTYVGELSVPVAAGALYDLVGVRAVRDGAFDGGAVSVTVHLHHIYIQHSS